MIWGSFLILGVAAIVIMSVVAVKMTVYRRYKQRTSHYCSTRNSYKSINANNLSCPLCGEPIEGMKKLSKLSCGHQCHLVCRVRVSLSRRQKLNCTFCNSDRDVPLMENNQWTSQPLEVVGDDEIRNELPRDSRDKFRCLQCENLITKEGKYYLSSRKWVHYRCPKFEEFDRNAEAPANDTSPTDGATITWKI